MKEVRAMEGSQELSAQGVANVILENEKLKEKGTLAYFFGRKFVVVQGDKLISSQPTNWQRIRWLLFRWKPEEYRRTTIVGQLQGRIQHAPDHRLLEDVKKYFESDGEERKKTVRNVSIAVQEILLDPETLEGELKTLAEASDDQFKERVQQFAAPVLQQLMKAVSDRNMEDLMKKLETSLVEAIKKPEVLLSTAILSECLGLSSDVGKLAAAERMLPLIGIDGELAQKIKECVTEPYVQRRCDSILSLSGVPMDEPKVDVRKIGVTEITGQFLSIDCKRGMKGDQMKRLVMRRIRKQRSNWTAATGKWHEAQLIFAGKPLADDARFDEWLPKGENNIRIVCPVITMEERFEGIQDETQRKKVIEGLQLLDKIWIYLDKYQYFE